jgi:hypothetical protein
MKCFTHVTPSHHRFLEEFFFPTASKEFDVVVYKGAQVGSPDYGTPGFNLSMIDKAKSMLQAAQEPLGSLVLWSDVDIQFLAPCKERLIECLGSNDMAFQSYGVGAVCSGFFFFRVTENVRTMLGRVLEDMTSGATLDDEVAMRKHVKEIPHVHLPTKEFWTSGFCGFNWAGDPKQLEQVRVPAEIRIHHGNCCIGVERKLELMRYVRSVVLKRSQSPQV